MFVALKSLHSPVVFSYKVLSRFYESFDHPSVRNGCEWCTYPVLVAGATYHLTGREINFFFDSHLAPKFFKVVAKWKKVGCHFQRQTMMY